MKSGCIELNRKSRRGKSECGFGLGPSPHPAKSFHAKGAEGAKFREGALRAGRAYLLTQQLSWR